MFSFRDTRGTVEVAFTDRFWADDPAATLDLAEPAPDDPEAARGRARLRRTLDEVGRALAPAGPSVLVRMRQVHGAAVHTVDRDWLDAQDPEALGEPPEADGLVTAVPGVALLVRAADCVPVLLADEEAGIVGAAHAGREGLVAGVVPATLGRMRALGAERVTAWVGPHICGHCYEVPAPMREAVAAAVPRSYAETSWSTPALDVGAGVVGQLEEAGVEVVDASRCTLESDDLWSYRREGGAAGRLGGLVWVRP